MHPPVCPHRRLFLYASPHERRTIGLCRVPFVRRQQGAALGPDLFDLLMYVRLVVEVYRNASEVGVRVCHDESSARARP